MDVVFLDANVLFSAAYRSQSRLRTLWGLTGVQLVSSRYAVEEARRNLVDEAQQEQLADLERALTIVPELPEADYERTNLRSSGLPAKDLPILGAAIAGRATHLLSGDVTHFAPLFEQTIGGVTILLPADYLRGVLGGGRAAE